MRLWHWKLIPVLPRQQLLGQWRECCAIVKNIHDLGIPNHILVNPIMDYPITEFFGYCKAVYSEMDRRGYTVMAKDFLDGVSSEGPFFNGWHNDQYLQQCYYNLQEKHDRGGITDEEWQKIQEAVGNVMQL